MNDLIINSSDKANEALWEGREPSFQQQCAELLDIIKAYDITFQGMYTSVNSYFT